MAEYINKQELIKNIVNTPISWDHPVTSEHLTGAAKRQNEILTLIDDMPTTDVRENKSGEWINHISDIFPADSTIECSLCHAEQPCGIDDNFCPNCGADMRGKKKMAKCTHGDGVTVEVGGIPVDPCVYKEIETHHNCTVRVMECVNCGNVEIEWEKERRPNPAHWQRTQYGDYVCSACGGEPSDSRDIWLYAYCPFCGAKMEEDERLDG